MLTQQENDYLTHTGPGTPMGELFRRYWQPFLLVTELPEADDAPVRVRLLGEDLVAFRDTNGKVGLINERCPHRGASLFFAINQECGMMCIYHGWKFDVNGNCVDMPSDLPGSVFKDKVHITSYPCIESAGAIWAYMGPAEKEPSPPNYVINNLPEANVNATRTPIYCNYLQSLEGNIDSTHLGTLHRSWDDFNPVDDGTDRPGYPSMGFSVYLRAFARYAMVDVQDTNYGFRLIATRPTPAGNKIVRINCQALPNISFIASQRDNAAVLILVPADDDNCFRMSFSARPDRPFSSSERESIRAISTYMDPAQPNLRMVRAENDYLIDRKAQKTTALSGIWPPAEQDYAITESMGPIYDRTKEHLYGGDAAIIRLRQMLIQSVKNLQEGIEPSSLDPTIPFHKIRSEEIIIGPDDDPWNVAVDAGETTKRGERLL
jgi:phenylpropionate dioxygenase-like ring-hydroxylating dioxygenase large terminal subunit